MNRIEQLLPSALQLATPAGDQVMQARISADTEVGCSLFVPLHYEPKYAYPLVVWLHGPQHSDQQLKRIMPLVSMRNYVGVAPRGLAVGGQRGSTMNPWSWPETAAATQAIEQRVFSSIAAARRKANISPRKIFLAGFGSGGTAALRVAMSHPQRFAGVLSLCGGFPSGGNPLARISHARRVPIFLACGQEAQEYPMDSVCDDLRLLHTAGMTVSLRVYPGGDDLSPHMLPDMDRWIMEQLSATHSVVKN